MINLVRQQVNRVDLIAARAQCLLIINFCNIIAIIRSNLKRPRLQLACERSGYYEAPKKEVKHEAMDSRKCGCEITTIMW